MHSADRQLSLAPPSLDDVPNATVEGNAVPKMTGAKLFAEMMEGYEVSHIFFVPAFMLKAFAIVALAADFGGSWLINYRSIAARQNS